MDESIAINGQELLLALAIPSEYNIEFIIGEFVNRIARNCF